MPNTAIAPETETPPELPEPKLINPDALEGAFSYEDGFHRADWNLVRRWIDGNVAPLDLEEAWNEAALLWVTKLHEDIGGDYFILQSPECVLLCDQKLETAYWLLEYTGRAASTITDYLDKTAWRGTFGKHAVLVFSDDDDYYQYLSHHSPDGEQAASGGVCIDSGYIHIAIRWMGQPEAANTIVHELTHDCLAHLPLPLWLNEGVAVTLQHAIAPLGFGRSPIMWDELAERHFVFWNEENIQSFWAGTSFFKPGEPNQLSYSLAEVCVKLSSEKSDAATFRAFLEAARSDDAGQTAAMDILGVDLGEIAGTFLGEGNWRPVRKAMVECWESAGWGKQEPNDDVPDEN